MSRPGIIQRQTTVTLVADELRRRILSGALAEGQQLRQEALAADLGVSRIPIREALRQLEAEGFVAIASHRGAVVSKLSLDEIAELFELRIRLETWLLELAIPRMTEDDLAQAEAALEAMISNRKIENWGALNWDFHAALYAPAARPATLRILRRINENTDRYIRLQISLTSGQLKAHREHKELLQLCRAGNAARAVAALEQHILDVRDGLVAELREVGPDGAKDNAAPRGNIRSAKV
jgi:DNA-binding GntR family transcriptional regulator